jgi:hypothetical protein
VGAADAVAFTLFVAADAASAPSAPFMALTLQDLDEDRLQTSGYSAAVSDAVLERDGRAFVIEGVFPADQVLGAGMRLEGILDATQTLTRLTTILPASSLTEDVTFDAPFSGEAPNERHVLSLPPWHAGGSGAFACVALSAAVLGRRLQPRKRRKTSSSR